MPAHSHIHTFVKRLSVAHHGRSTPSTSAVPHGARHPDRPASRTGRARSVLLAVLLVAQLMVILDITAVNIALPSLARDLQLSGSTVAWTITSYSLVFGSLLLFGGRLADLVGRKRLFLTGLGVFTTSSIASALAGTAAALFAARAGQGLGAAMLSPAALSIITTAFQGKQRAKALAAWGAVGGAGAAIGVLIGGVLTEIGDWRLIFYVNIPVAIGLAVAAVKVIPRDVEKPRWRGLDAPGALLGTLSIATLVYAITQADKAGWGSAQTIGLAILGLVGLGAFAAWERHTEKPLLRVERIADRAVGGGLFLMLVAAGSIFGLFLLCSLYLQNVLGTSPLLTGLAFIPLALSAGLGAHAAGHVVSRHGVRTPLVSAFLIAAAGMVLLAHVGEHGTYVRNILPGMIVAGFGLGIAVVSVSISVMTGTREDESGMISGLSATGHEIGGTVGIAVFSTIAAGATGAVGGAHAAAGVSHAFIAAAALTGLASIVALLVLPHARDFVPKLRLNPQAMPMH
jgi:EmrB/QacA subfamily drug resistance transporter